MPQHLRVSFGRILGTYQVLTGAARSSQQILLRICLNGAANHGFISRSGITTLAELVQMHQDLYNVGLDLAIVLATVTVALDGDILTGKLFIGKESSAVPGLLRTLGELNAHN
ncbi:unnamed protein product [Adineta ricciae]|uniref:Heme haloperoxidase family profile domain-containing protein n=1 Tax=Adineta ricciae TaxID=249248 RepID=A0A814G2D9_ADIRI|nr:unnamed protein product [Adineta ricciae]